jgi:hypothetical protein
MARAAKVVCPYCAAEVEVPPDAHGVATLECHQCASSFQAKISDPSPSSDSTALPAALPIPATSGRGSSGPSKRRLAVVLCGAFLYLASGAGLTAYCLQRNARDSGAALSAENVPPPPEPLALPSGRDRSTVTVSAAEQRRIDDAIVNGVWYLKNMAGPTGRWDDTGLNLRGQGLSLGLTALPALTLLECGIPESDPIVQKAASLVREKAPRLAGMPHHTYQRSLALLFLDRLGDPGDRELIQYLALSLIAGQNPVDFGWSYNLPELNRQSTGELLRLLGDEKQTLDGWRQQALKGVAFAPAESDNSNTQFAILALWVARRHGVSIEYTIGRVEQRFNDTQVEPARNRDGQNADGAWPYKKSQPRASDWATMTCSGLLGLAVAQGLSGERREKDRAWEERSARIRHGLTVLAGEINRPDDKRPMDLYFLWSLERVGVLYNLDKIESKDWFAWGRKPLLEHQDPDGSWKDGNYYGCTPFINTCFALLFLKQANLAADLTDKLRLLGEKP